MPIFVTLVTCGVTGVYANRLPKHQLKLGYLHHMSPMLQILTLGHRQTRVHDVSKPMLKELHPPGLMH